MRRSAGMLKYRPLGGAGAAGSDTGKGKALGMLSCWDPSLELEARGVESKLWERGSPSGKTGMSWMLLRYGRPACWASCRTQKNRFLWLSHGINIQVARVSGRLKH